MIYSLRWILAAPLLLLFLWAAVFNLWVVVLICRNAISGERKRVPSFCPLVGGVAGGVGLYLCPVEGVSRYAWLALVVDVGSLPYFLLVPPLLLRLWLRGKLNSD